MEEAPLNDAWFFDCESAQWSALTHVGEPPAPRSFHKMVASPTGADQQTLYVFGGCAAAGRLADFHAATFDRVTKTLTWNLCPDPPGCRGRGGAGFAFVPSPAPSGSVVVLAGFAGEETRDMYVYDIGEGSWSEIELSGDKFIPRSVFAIAAVGDDAMTIFGGEVGESARGHEGAGDFAGDTLTVNLKGVVSAHKSADTERASPPARGWAAYDGNEGRMVLCGGLAGDDANPVRLDDVWVRT